MKTYFNDLSHSYYLNEICSFGITNLLRNRLVKRIRDYDGKQVLDLMSGTGENLNYIHNKNNLVSITTLDYSENMNLLSRKKNIDKRFVQITSDFFDYKTEHKYDIILCSFGVKTIPKDQLKHFAKKINGLLTKNGEALFLELAKPKRFIPSYLLKLYLRYLVPVIFCKKIKPLFKHIEKHNSFDELKQYIIAEQLKVIAEHRHFYCFETLHLKKYDRKNTNL